ncbi:MAG TPA: erythromycin esterase family protein [Thermoanaerobaculia bacterium]
MRPGRPRSRRRAGIAIAVLAPLAALVALAGGPPSAAVGQQAGEAAGLGDGRDAERAAIADLLDHERAAKGLGPVKLVTALSRAAQAHAADMEARGYLGFTSPDGKQIEDWVKAAGYEAQLVAEKIEQTNDPPARMAAYWGQSAELQKKSLFLPEVDELGVGIGREKARGRAIYTLVLTRSTASYLAEYTRRLFAEQTARFHDLPALRREMLARLNEARAGKGLPPLAEDAALDRAAQDHAVAIFHALTAGRPLPAEGALAGRVRAEGYRFHGNLGEDVVQGALSPEDTLASLLGRGNERPQALRKKYTHLGLGLAVERRGEGFFAVWVQCLAYGESAGELAGREAAPDARADWLRARAVALRTADPADEDYRDLAPLAAALAGARIVMLGEATHGDGAAFRAKSRLVRFLHRELGFSVLAFESGLYDCAKAWEQVSAAPGADDSAAAAARGVFGIWSASAEVRPLLADLGRLSQGAAPLELAGFDSQFTGSASKDFLVADLARYLASIGSPTVAGQGWPDLARRIQALIVEGGMPAAPVPDRAARRDFARDLERLDGEIAQSELAVGPQRAFWRQVLHSTRAEAEIDWDLAGDDVRGNRRRDLQMAENLLWLARERYAGRKIVVWAATRHIVANPGRIATIFDPPAPVFPGGAAMGDVVKKALGRDVYALGITAAGGWWGKAGDPPRELPPPPPGSLEDLWSRGGTDLAFVDFRNLPAGGSWLKGPLVARPLGYAPMRADWASTLDGMLFLRTMTPATRVEASPRAP